MAHRVSLPEDMKNILADFLMPAKIEIKSQMRRVLYDINQLRRKNPKKIREWTTCAQCGTRKQISLSWNDIPQCCVECISRYLAEEEMNNKYENEWVLWRARQEEPLSP